jgi:hypothetical protein
VPEKVPERFAERPPERTPERSLDISAAWPHYVFATSAVPQPCFDQTNQPVEGADLEEDERVLLVLDGDVCRTTRVATNGELFTTRVDKFKFKDFQPLP